MNQWRINLLELNNEQKIHFIGVLGSGMYPLAQLSKKLGFTISGSDIQNKNYNFSDTLKIYPKQDPSNIKDADLVVYSSAISSENTELLAAKNLKKKILHRSDLLSFFLNNYKSITVAGTHGKTTTSALIKHILSENKLEHQGVIGGKLCTEAKESCNINKKLTVVAEADESDGTFLKYNPNIAVITNIDLDHMDYYKDIDDICNHFSQHASNIKELGTLIYNADDENSVKTFKNIKNRRKITFSILNKGTLQAVQFQELEINKSVLHISYLNKQYRLIVPFIGLHNVYNTLAATLACLQMGLKIEQVINAVRSFPGVQRRFELIVKKENYVIYDDYAHNPEKIRSVISTAKKFFSNSHIYVLFEAHRYSRLKKVILTIFTSLYRV